MIESCALISIWNKNVTTVNDYTSSYEGMQTMAASCMLIESIGESAKKIERIAFGLLIRLCPEIHWNAVIGLRNHIAHGYFNLDADIIYDVVVNEIPELQKKLMQLKERFPSAL